MLPLASQRSPIPASIHIRRTISPFLLVWTFLVSCLWLMAPGATLTALHVHWPFSRFSLPHLLRSLEFSLILSLFSSHLFLSSLPVAACLSLWYLLSFLQGFPPFPQPWAPLCLCSPTVYSSDPTWCFLGFPLLSRTDASAALSCPSSLASGSCDLIKSQDTNHSASLT